MQDQIVDNGNGWDIVDDKHYRSIFGKLQKKNTNIYIDIYINTRSMKTLSGE